MSIPRNYAVMLPPRIMKRSQRHILIFLFIALPISVGGIIGWSYLWQRPCTHIKVMGVVYADSTSIHQLIGNTLSPQLVIDRVQRHPWVRGVHAICYPTRTMRVEVLERQPQLLTLNGSGTPAYYLDEFGYMIPAHTQATFDVPLLRGSTDPYRAMSPVNDPVILDLLTLLPRLPAEINSLISEFEVTENGLTMIMRTTNANPVAVVHLGEMAWEERLQRLHRFWEQKIRSREDRMVEFIDLRFRGQIVTKEKPI